MTLPLDVVTAIAESTGTTEKRLAISGDSVTFSCTAIFGGHLSSKLSVTTGGLYEGFESPAPIGSSIVWLIFPSMFWVASTAAAADSLGPWALGPCSFPT